MRTAAHNRQRLLIELLPPLPDNAVCAAVADHEKQVQQGVYENVIQTGAKYAQNELAVRSSPAMRRQWQRLKSAFNVSVDNTRQLHTFARNSPRTGCERLARLKK
jgi:hypothetical protein